MTDDPNSLDKLWQQQSVQSIDVLAIQRRFLKERWRQRLYWFLDLLGFVPFIYIYGFAPEKLSLLAHTIFGVMGAFALLFFVYISYLRRHALFAQSGATATYTHVLLKQYAANQRIAQLTKHSCYAVVILIAAIYAIFRYAGEMSDEKWQVAQGSVGVVAVIMLGVYYWAHKRQQKFAKELKNLQTMLSQDKV